MLRIGPVKYALIHAAMLGFSSSTDFKSSLRKKFNPNMVVPGLEIDWGHECTQENMVAKDYFGLIGRRRLVYTCFSPIAIQRIQPRQLGAGGGSFPFS